MNVEQKQNKIIRPKSIYTMSAEEQNQITSELQNLIAEGGLTPSENDLTQVKNAVKNIADQSAAAIGARTVNALGIITQTTALDTNTNYTATLSGSATFTLPTPSDTSIENTINLLLNVTASTTVDWGVNANSVLSSFAAGKYEIRLRYNNSTSNWVGEVLKENEASSSVRLLVRFNGDMSDESASPITLTPSRIVAEFPVYAEGQYGTQKLTCTGDSIDNYVTASGDNLSKLNLGVGDFTIKCWLTLASGSGYPVRIFYKDGSNQISLGYERILIRIGGNLLLNQGFSGLNMGDTAYITLTRKNGVLYFFVNGTLVTFQASTEAWNLSDWTQIFKGSSVSGIGHYGIQELIVKNTCDYVADFTIPTAPYVLADNSLADLHDKSLAAKIAELETEINNLKGAIMRRMDFANAVALTMSSGTYTMPSDGYLQLNYTPSTAQTYQFKLNNQNIYISNVSLMPVSKNDILGLNSTPFNGFFIPEKSN